MKRDRRSALATVCAVVCIAAGATTEAADLQLLTIAAFNRYVRLTELRMDAEAQGTLPFLWIDRLTEPQRSGGYSNLRRGEIFVSRMETRDVVPGGMCHHWVGTILAPDADLKSTVALMQSYDRYQEIYRPAVRRSKTLAREGDRFTVFLQLFMSKVVSVVLNIESDVQYLRDGTRQRISLALQQLLRARRT